VRRLLALAAVYDGASRGESAALGGMDRQLLRDWALRFNAEGPGGLIDRKAPGARSKLTPEQLSGCRPWRAWSRMARSRPSTGWSAGGSSIWWGGSTTSTACRWTPAGWAGSSKAWATRAFRRGPSITLRTSTPWRRSRETFPLRIQEIRDKLPQGTQLEICHQIPRGQRSHCRTSNLRTKSYPGSKRLNGANLIPLGFFLRVGDGSTQSRFRAGTTRTNRSLQSPRNRRSAEGDRWTGSNS
jgi:hypothetical protein